MLFTLALATILGASGLSFDMARMYLAREEGRSFADAAALAAAMQLNGAPDGIAAARLAAFENWKLHSFGTSEYSRAVDNSGDIEVWFCQEATCASPALSPEPAMGYRFAQVKTKSEVPLFLLPLVTGRFHTTVVSEAIAGQVRADSWIEGLFPFAVAQRELPFDISPGESQNFGLGVDGQYTFAWSPTADLILEQAFNAHAINNAEGRRWTAAELISATVGTEVYQDLERIGEYLRVDVGPGAAWCSGDTTVSFLKTLIRVSTATFEPVPDTTLSSTYSKISTDRLLSNKGSYRAPGAPIPGTSAISEGSQGGIVYYKTLGVTDPVEPRSVALQDAIIALTRQDANQSVTTNGVPSGSVASYFAVTPIGTGERLVILPVIDKTGLAVTSATIVGFRAFLLLADDCPGCPGVNKHYDSVATPPRDNWCAAFAGDALEPVAGRTAGVNGVYTVRLIR